MSAPACPLWMPNGMVIRQELEFLATQEERRDGYKRVSTPEITKENLYIRSRHLAYYGDDMYSPIDIEGENYYLKPMNCPHHHMIYLATRHSYRELPLRLAEYGHCYRYEASGGLSGLMRVRGFTQNDAHIYCRLRPGQGRVPEGDAPACPLLRPDGHQGTITCASRCPT